MKKMTFAAALTVSGIATMFFGASVDENATTTIAGFHLRNLAFAAGSAQIIAPFSSAAYSVYSGVEHQLI